MISRFSVTQRRILFLIYYVIFAAAVGYYFGRSGWVTNYKLSNNSIETKAVLTKTDCSSPLTLAYRFSAGGNVYEGRGEDAYGNPLCRALKVGDQVLVSYLAADPRINVAGDPKARLYDKSILIVTAGVLLPLIVLFILFVLLKGAQIVIDASSPK